MTQIIVPSRLRTAKGEARERHDAAFEKAAKHRVTFSVPHCAHCDRPVDSIRMERFKQDEFNYIALIAKCHGNEEVREFLEFGPQPNDLGTFFKNDK